MIRRFDKAAYEAEMERALVDLERNGAFAPLKAIMRRHLAKAKWKAVFLELIFKSVAGRPTRDSLRRSPERSVGAIKSMCSLRVADREALSKLPRTSLLKGLARLERMAENSKGVEIAFFPCLRGDLHRRVRRRR